MGACAWYHYIYFYYIVCELDFKYNMINEEKEIFFLQIGNVFQSFIGPRVKYLVGSIDQGPDHTSSSGSWPLVESI